MTGLFASLFADRPGSRRRHHSASRLEPVPYTSVGELEVQEEGVSVAWYQVRDNSVERARHVRIARQDLPIEVATRHIVRLHQVAHGKSELAVIEKQVLAIRCDSEIFIDLVADADDEALEVQWVLRNVVVRHK